MPNIARTAALGSALLLFSAAAVFDSPAFGSEPEGICDEQISVDLRRQAPADAFFMQLPRTGKVIAHWTDAQTGPGYGVSADGREFQRLGPASYTLRLRYADFDPLTDGQPHVPAALRADGDGLAPHGRDGQFDRERNEIFIVQFITQPLEEYRAEIRDLGATIYKFLAHHSYIVRMDAATRQAVQNLPYVRWVGEYHPAYRLEEHLLAGLTDETVTLADKRYRIQVFERGLSQKNIVAQRVRALGGVVELKIPDGFIIEATLSADELLEIAHSNEVMFIDRWGAPEPDMDLARIIGGANYVQSVGGYTGAGVRAEVKDGNIFANHVEFANNPPMIRTSLSGGQAHGTSTYGIVFSSGNNVAQSRGVLSGAQQGIFSSYNHVNNRYTHTAALLQAPYFGVFQSNSWGSPLTTQYNTFSAEMDDILFNFDITILQSQSNAGTQSSRPQAWAKNVVSVGGVRHYNTLNKSQHAWANGASIGPAADGRVKPDFTHFYDSVFTTRPSNSYTDSFSGTSAATPITAGYFGLFYEMWSDGLFGNPVDPDGTVFENRPRSTTAKAVLVNTASQYPFAGTSHDLTRMHQGWGMVDVQNLYDLRENIYIVDGTDVLSNLQSTVYEFNVPVGADAFRATMVYLDPSGTTSSNLHRINDLDLRVVSPSGVTYHGNVGLHTGVWSAPGGQPMGIDTVENVFVNNPEPGTWEVTVFAAEIVEDAYPLQDGLHAAYSLVVSGIDLTPVCLGDLTGSGAVDVSDLLLLLASWGPCGSCAADLDGSGVVDVSDLLILLGAWGPCS